jgi:hypothetical protein
MIFAYFGISVLMKAANSSGLLPMGSAPSVESRSRVSGVCRMRAISL